MANVRSGMTPAEVAQAVIQVIAEVCHLDPKTIAASDKLTGLGFDQSHSANLHSTSTSSK